MFDDFHFEDWTESQIYENRLNYIGSKCFPNPVNELLTIQFENTDYSIFMLEVFDITGRQIVTQNNIKSSEIFLDTKSFASGIHYYRLIDTENSKYGIGKFSKK